MSEIAKVLEDKARVWTAEAERTTNTEEHRAMFETLGREYGRLARERLRSLDSIAV